nr:hypothetical protein Iba_chr04eCG18550 [Ipomoea batatas]
MATSWSGNEPTMKPSSSFPPPVGVKKLVTRRGNARRRARRGVAAVRTCGGRSRWPVFRCSRHGGGGGRSLFSAVVVGLGDGSSRTSPFNGS